MIAPFLAAAALLSIERVSYVWVCRHPGRLRTMCAGPVRAAVGEPTELVRLFFYAFKTVQIGVFAGWCDIAGHGRLWPPDGTAWSMALGGALIVIGQTLNAGVFYQIGTMGVFYGNKFGYALTWSRSFPFSLFRHPQYIGTLMSIWGLFLILRWPHADWVALPVLETIYYVLGSRLEE